MISIEHYESSVFMIEKDFQYLRTKNTIHVSDESCTLDIGCITTDDTQDSYKCSISFKINKDFIQEMKAMIMIMEHIREKIS